MNHAGAATAPQPVLHRALQETSYIYWQQVKQYE